MKKILYIDCFSGISGDMMVGALIDLGLDFDFLKEELGKINIGGYEVKSEKTKKSGISASKFIVETTHDHHHRTYSDILNLINSSSIKKKAKEISISIFDIIATAEAKVHQVEKEKIHFHEVGAVDSIVDIAGTAIGITQLEIREVFCANIPLGKGFVQTMHGLLPVPAPATLEILRDVPVYDGNFDFEVTTPTGAAIAKSLTKSFGGIPLIKVKGTGFGCGTIEKEGPPNLLRLVLGEKSEPQGESTDDFKFANENLTLLSTNIDDASPEILGYLMEKLFEEKVLDAWTEPIFMKKNRQAVKVSVLCIKSDVEKILNILFTETSTLGIRRSEIKRYLLQRKFHTVKLPYGEAKIKVGYKEGKALTTSPEYESCRALAKKTGKPIKEVYRDMLCFFSIK
ncbi:MAG: nickel pincer cofactor biosynthesis protein LarC [Actinomycetota bacterium]|nr:nickel pincer cofactor biosynthesis protein LarC [Actinomycetota bacterium]